MSDQRVKFLEINEIDSTTVNLNSAGTIGTVGAFNKGKVFDPLTITKNNLSSVLGFPNNNANDILSYNVLQNLLNNYTNSIKVVRALETSKQSVAGKFSNEISYPTKYENSVISPNQHTLLKFNGGHDIHYYTASTTTWKQIRMIDAEGVEFLYDTNLNPTEVIFIVLSKDLEVYPETNESSITYAEEMTGETGYVEHFKIDLGNESEMLGLNSEYISYINTFSGDFQGQEIYNLLERNDNIHTMIEVPVAGLYFGVENKTNLNLVGDEFSFTHTEKTPIISFENETVIPSTVIDSFVGVYKVNPSNEEITVSIFKSSDTWEVDSLEVGDLIINSKYSNPGVGQVVVVVSDDNGNIINDFMVDFQNLNAVNSKNINIYWKTYIDIFTPLINFYVAPAILDSEIIDILFTDEATNKVEFKIEGDEYLSPGVSPTNVVDIGLAYTELKNVENVDYLLDGYFYSSSGIKNNIIGLCDIQTHGFINISYTEGSLIKNSINSVVAQIKDISVEYTRGYKHCLCLGINKFIDEYFGGNIEIPLSVSASGNAVLTAGNSGIQYPISGKQIKGAIGELFLITLFNDKTAIDNLGFLFSSKSPSKGRHIYNQRTFITENISQSRYNVRNTIRNIARALQPVGEGFIDQLQDTDFENNVIILITDIMDGFSEALKETPTLSIEKNDDDKVLKISIIADVVDAIEKVIFVITERGATIV